MKGFLKRATPPDLLKSYGPFLGCIVIGCAEKRWWCPGPFFASLTDAVIIAGIIGFFIELWAASVLIKHVSEETAHRLVGRGLPKPAQDLMWSIVNDTKIVLRNYRAVFRMDVNPDTPDYLSVCLTLTYTALNNGTRTEMYGPQLSEELIYNPRLELLEYADKSFAADLLATKIGGTQLAWHSPKIPLEPSEATAVTDSLRPEQAIKVRWVYLMDMPIRYSAVLSFATVVIDPEIQFTPSPTGPKIRFEANPHESLRHAANGLQWEYKRAFIRDQAIRVWWEPQASTGE